MDCPKVLNNLVAYLDGALDENSSSQIKEHLTSCHDCNKEVQRLEKTWALLDNYPELELKAGMVNQTMAKIKTLAQEKPAWIPRPWAWEKIAGLATAAVLLIALSLIWINHTPKTSIDPGLHIAETQEVKELKVLLDYYTDFLEDLEEASENYYDIKHKNGLEELPSFFISEEPFNSFILPEDKNIKI